MESRYPDEYRSSTKSHFSLRSEKWGTVVLNMRSYPRNESAVNCRKHTISAGRIEGDRASRLSGSVRRIEDEDLDNSLPAVNPIDELIVGTQIKIGVAGDGSCLRDRFVRTFNVSDCRVRAIGQKDVLFVGTDIEPSGSAARAEHRLAAGERRLLGVPVVIEVQCRRISVIVVLQTKDVAGGEVLFIEAAVIVDCEIGSRVGTQLPSVVLMV
jgi:hypothetical protein